MSFKSNVPSRDNRSPLPINPLSPPPSHLQDQPTPSSPLSSSSLIRAHLPEGQRTTISVKEGMTIRDALMKAMKTRDLTPSTCVIYTEKPHAIIDWDTDTRFLSGQEVFVEYQNNTRLASTNHHNFVRKTFITLAFCDVCKKLLFQGFRCEICGFRYHMRSRCSNKVPVQCGGVDDDLIMAYILSQQPQRTEDSPQPSTPIPPSPTSHQRVLVPLKDEDTDVTEVKRRQRNNSTLTSRQRSISTPNVLYNPTISNEHSILEINSATASTTNNNLLVPPTPPMTIMISDSSNVFSYGNGRDFPHPIRISGRTEGGSVSSGSNAGGMDAMRVDRRKRGHKRQSSVGHLDNGGIYGLDDSKERRNSTEGNKFPTERRLHSSDRYNRHRSLDRQSSSGDQTSDSISPTGQSPLQTPTGLKPPLHGSLSSTDSGLGRTNYNSSTLPSQRRRQRLLSEDKRNKVCLLPLLSFFG
jgi:hypothetical protein